MELFLQKTQNNLIAAPRRAKQEIAEGQSIPKNQRIMSGSIHTLPSF